MIDRIVRIDLRIVTLQVPPQDIISKDNVPVRVTAVVYFRIVDPRAAVVAIENYLVGTSQIAQTTLRSVLGQHSLDELLAERDRINEILQGIIDQQTEPWGVKVTVVEVKDVELPSGMQRAMARQAEAERERRAKIIGAEGEFQASEKLAQAAEVLSRDPAPCSCATCRPCSRSAGREQLDDALPDPDRPVQALRRRRAAVRRRRVPARGAGSARAARARSRTRVAAWGSGSIPYRGCGSSSRPGGPTARARSSDRAARRAPDAGAVPVLCRARGSDAAGDPRPPRPGWRLGVFASCRTSSRRSSRPTARRRS